MAITNSSLAWKTEFLLNETTKQFQFTDQTDYAAAGDSDSDKLGYFKIVSPDGTTFYQNAAFDISPVYTSPDIDINNGDTTNIETGVTIAVPLLSGLLLQGTYTIYYKIRDTGTTTNYDASKTFDVFYTKPVADITLEADVYTPELTSTDETNYTITINGATFSPSVTRVHTIIYPQGLGTVSGTGATLSTQYFYTDTNQSKVVATCTWSIGSNVYIVDEVTGGAELKVYASQGLCDAYCAVKSLYDRWQAAIATNTTNAVTLGSNFVIAMSIMGLIKQAYACGEVTDIDNLFVQLYKYAPDNCGCQGTNDPQLITAIGSPTDPFNTILNGTTAPDDADGNNGDFYINTADSNIPLYIKSAGSWALVANLKGATGATGATGAAGANGSNGTNGTTVLEFVPEGTAINYTTDPQVVALLTIGAGELAADGDTARISLVYLTDTTSGLVVALSTNPTMSNPRLHLGSLTGSITVSTIICIHRVSSTEFNITTTTTDDAGNCYATSDEGTLGGGSSWSSAMAVRLNLSGGTTTGSITIKSLRLDKLLIA